MAYQVRPAVYRDKHGFAITGNAPGERGFSISIFVRCRSTAVRIRNAYRDTAKAQKLVNNYEQRRALADRRDTRVDTLIRADARVKFCRR